MPDESYEEARLRLLLEFSGVRAATFSLRPFGDSDTKIRMASDGIVRANIIGPGISIAKGSATVNGVTTESVSEHKVPGIANIAEILQPGLDLIAPFLPEIESKLAAMTDVQLKAQVDNFRPNNQWYILALKEMGKRIADKEQAESRAREQERIDIERRHREQIEVAKEQSASAKVQADAANKKAAKILAIVIALLGTIAMGLQAYYARVAILDARSSANKAAATPTQFAKPESRPIGEAVQYPKDETPTKPQAPTPESGTPKPAAEPKPGG